MNNLNFIHESTQFKKNAQNTRAREFEIKPFQLTALSSLSASLSLSLSVADLDVTDPASASVFCLTFLSTLETVLHLQVQQQFLCLISCVACNQSSVTYVT